MDFCVKTYEYQLLSEFLLLHRSNTRLFLWPIGQTKIKLKLSDSSRVLQFFSLGLWFLLRGGRACNCCRFLWSSGQTNWLENIRPGLLHFWSIATSHLGFIIKGSYWSLSLGRNDWLHLAQINKWVFVRQKLQHQDISRIITLLCS